MHKIKNNFPLLLLLLFSTFLFAKNINSFPLRNWDEAWYAEIIKNMAVRNTGIIMPFWNGNYFFDKPPLYFWLTFPIIKLFGMGEWQVRIVSVISALIIIYLIYKIGRNLFNQRIGLISSVIFLSFGQVTERFSKGNLDALMIFMTLSAFYFYLISHQKKSLYLLSGIFVGLTALSKGLVFALYPMTIIISYEVLINIKVNKNILLISLIAILVISAWLVVGSLKLGKPFLDWYLLNPLNGNLSIGVFSIILINDLIRDIGIWLFSIILIAKNLNKKIIIYLSLISLIFILPLGFYKEIFGWYILPSYSLISLIIGYSLSQRISNNKVLLGVIIVFFTMQMAHNKSFENKDYNTSLKMAELGQKTSKIVPKADLLFSNYTDFPTFLYYSDHEKVTVINSKAGHANEWWIISHKDFQNLNLNNYWIVKNDDVIKVNL